MNQGEANQPLTIATVGNARQLLDQWTASLGQVLQSMTDQTPQVQWQAGSPPETPQELLWWEQSFQVSPGVTAWVGAPSETWQHLGTMTLRAAGLETVEIAEAKSTWLEILSQSLLAMAHSIGSFLGRDVICETGAERAPGADQTEFASVSMAFEGSPPAGLWIALSSRLLATLVPRSSPNAAATVEPPSAPGPDARSPDRHSEMPPTMDLLMEVELPVSISFGKTQLPMRDVLKLTTGSIVELNRGVNETVEVLVNHCLIARGEVVVVEGNYGVRIQQIASRQDRLRSVR